MDWDISVQIGWLEPEPPIWNVHDADTWKYTRKYDIRIDIIRIESVQKPFLFLASRRLEWKDGSNCRHTGSQTLVNICLLDLANDPFYIKKNKFNEFARSSDFNQTIKFMRNFKMKLE